LENQALAEDKRVVEAEMKKYEDSGMIAEDDPRAEDFDLLRFWQVSSIYI